jgi:hypothetical protein
MDENPATKAARAAGMTLVCAAEHGPQGDNPSEKVHVPAQQVQLRKSQVLGAQHHRQAKIAEHRGDRGDHKKKHHENAVHGEQLVVGVGIHKVVIRREKLQAHDGDRSPT